MSNAPYKFALYPSLPSEYRLSLPPRWLCSKIKWPEVDFRSSLERNSETQLFTESPICVPLSNPSQMVGSGVCQPSCTPNNSQIVQWRLSNTCSQNQPWSQTCLGERPHKFSRPQVLPLRWWSSRPCCQRLVPEFWNPSHLLHSRSTVSLLWRLSLQDRCHCWCLCRQQCQRWSLHPILLSKSLPLRCQWPQWRPKPRYNRLALNWEVGPLQFWRLEDIKYSHCGM